jgi:hypothetical protein
MWRSFGGRITFFGFLSRQLNFLLNPTETSIHFLNSSKVIAQRFIEQINVVLQMCDDRFNSEQAFGQFGQRWMTFIL